MTRSRLSLLAGVLGAALIAGPVSAQLPIIPDLPIVDPIVDPVLDPLDPVLDPLDPVLDPIEDIVDPLVPGLPDLPTDPTDVIDDPTGILDDLTDILDGLGPILDPADPILDTVTGIIDELDGIITDVLADVILPNLLALKGEDAVDASIAFSQATYDSSDTAIIARDDVFADALTTGALQGIFDAPLLLTGSSDLDSRTARELVRLGVERLVILGADSAINPLVVQKLQIAGLDVTRVGGPSRVETATLAAAETAPNATTAVLTRAYSADGDDSQAYADLLAVSPWAAENDWPVLLTQTDTLTPSVASYLTDSAITEVVIIGGETAVSAATQQAVEALGITTRRVSGSNRYATAVAVANERGFANSGDADRLILAEGTSSRSDVWAPGFASAAHGATHRAPVLLTAGDVLPAETMSFITEGLEANLTDGGPATVCASFVSPIACEAAGLLLLGDLLDAVDLLDLDLTDLPLVGDLLDVIEQVTGVELPDLDGLLGDPLGAVDGVTGGGAGGLDPVTDVVGGVLGGGN